MGYEYTDGVFGGTALKLISNRLKATKSNLESIVLHVKPNDFTDFVFLAICKDGTLLKLSDNTGTQVAGLAEAVEDEEWMQDVALFEEDTVYINNGFTIDELMLLDYIPTIEELETWSTSPLYDSQEANLQYTLIEQTAQEVQVIAAKTTEIESDIANLEVSASEIQSTVSSVTENLENVQTTVSQLADSYTINVVKTKDGNENVATGIKMLLDDADISHFIIQANRFKLIGSNNEDEPVGSGQSVFEIDTETGKTYLHSDVLLRGNLIQSGGGEYVPVPVYIGEYDSSKTYHKGDVVGYMGSTWIYKNSTPTFARIPALDSDFWDIYSQEGKRGQMSAFKGKWQANEIYRNTDEIRDIVKYNDEFYLREKKGESGEGVWVEEYWTNFGGTFESIATRLMLSENAFIDQTLYVGEGDSKSAGISSVGGVRFWAGGDIGIEEDIEKVPFRVEEDGTVYAAKGVFSGSVRSEGTFEGKRVSTVLEDGKLMYYMATDKDGASGIASHYVSRIIAGRASHGQPVYFHFRSTPEVIVTPASLLVGGTGTAVQLDVRADNVTRMGFTPISQLIIPQGGETTTVNRTVIPGTSWSSGLENSGESIRLFVTVRMEKKAEFKDVGFAQSIYNWRVQYRAAGSGSWLDSDTFTDILRVARDTGGFMFFKSWREIEDIQYRTHSISVPKDIYEIRVVLDSATNSEGGKVRSPSQRFVVESWGYSDFTEIQDGKGDVYYIAIEKDESSYTDLEEDD